MIQGNNQDSGAKMPQSFCLIFMSEDIIIYTYSALRKYSYPIIVFMFCYVAALCKKKNSTSIYTAYTIMVKQKK